jgi:hypothetical protein
VRQHQILEGIRWIPSDTSGGVLGRGLTQVISVIDLRPRARDLQSAHRQPARTTACRKPAIAVPLGMSGDCGPLSGVTRGYPHHNPLTNGGGAAGLIYVDR